MVMKTCFSLSDYWLCNIHVQWPVSRIDLHVSPRIISRLQALLLHVAVARQLALRCRCSEFYGYISLQAIVPSDQDNNGRHFDVHQCIPFSHDSVFPVHYSDSVDSQT